MGDKRKNIIVGALLASTLLIMLAAGGALWQHSITFPEFLSGVLPLFTYWAGLFTNME